MQYPLVSEYIEAIRSAEDNLDQLSDLRPVLDNRGNPYLWKGSHAVVFKMQDVNTKRLYAVKCFTHELSNRNDHYQKIAERLQLCASPYLLHFRFIERELFVDTSQSDEEYFPVLVMDWAEGITLDTVRDLLSVDTAAWLEDVENIKEFYAQVGDHVPQAMYDELAALEARLKAAR